MLNAEFLFFLAVGIVAFHRRIVSSNGNILGEINFILSLSVFNSYICLTLFLFAQTDLPLVGNIAPDFEAEAVFDQEFIKVAYKA